MYFLFQLKVMKVNLLFVLVRIFVSNVKVKFLSSDQEVIGFVKFVLIFEALVLISEISGEKSNNIEEGI